MKSLRASFQAAADRQLDAMERKAERSPNRVPLTTSQHILHLLLTVFTAGLWAPVWIVRAMRGNPARGSAKGGNDLS